MIRDHKAFKDRLVSLVIVAPREMTENGERRVIEERRVNVVMTAKRVTWDLLENVALLVLRV